jgi:hypothetical protein
VRHLGILAWLAAAAACGKVKDSPPDGPDVPPDGPVAPVKVTVLTTAGDGAPEVMAKVLFQDPEGNVVFEGGVDPMGKIEAMLPRGGTVTSIRITTDTATTLSAQLNTITGVKPGDDLTFGYKARLNNVSGGGQTTMTANFTPVTGASHVFYTACGQSLGVTASPVTLTFRDSCHGATFDLMAVASGGMLTTPRYIRLNDINYENGQSFTIPVGFSPMSNFTINALNVPAEISSMSGARSSMLDNAAVAKQSASAGDPPAGTVALTVPYGTTVGTRAEVELSFARSADATGSQTHAVHTATIASSINIDLDRQKLPWFSSLVWNSTGATWNTVVPGDTPDGQIMLWTGRWTIGTRQTNISWRIAHAPSATEIKLPRLSPTHAALDPQAQTAAITSIGGNALYTVDYDVLDGYDGYRQQPETLTFVTLDDINAFVGMPFQRRLYPVAISLPPP